MDGSWGAIKQSLRVQTPIGGCWYACIYIYIYIEIIHIRILFLIIIYILSFYTIIAFPCYYWCHYTHQIHPDAVVPCHLVYVFWLISNESLFNLRFVHRYGWDSNFQFWTMLGSPKTEHTFPQKWWIWKRQRFENMIILDIHINFRGSPEHTQKWWFPIEWFPIEISLFWETMFRMWIFQGCNTSIYIFPIPYWDAFLASFLRFIHKVCRKSRKRRSSAVNPLSFWDLPWIDGYPNITTIF